MLLIAIGESLKKIDKLTDKKLLLKYDSVDWKGAKGLRDIITHHYFDVDVKYIFEVCKNKLPNVLSVLLQIRNDLN